MIKTNEVRRGNLVAYARKEHKRGNVPEAFKKGLIIEEIETESFICFDGLNFLCGFSADSLEGIPLAPGVLEKLGFKYREHLQDFYLKFGGNNAIIIIRDTPLHNETKIAPSNGGSATAKPCHFLHDLQNLYFTLTGEELDIKSLLK
jgi:hypothetical protein